MIIESSVATRMVNTLALTVTEYSKGINQKGRKDCVSLWQ